MNEKQIRAYARLIIRVGANVQKDQTVVIACPVECADFGNATGTGMPTMEPFHALTIEHTMKHGFQYFGMITVVTDVVRENNQTDRLVWSEQCKDGSKMGVG